MSENPHKKHDFLEVAKTQLAHVTAEFEKALDTLKDQERRKQLTSSYLEMLQKGLSKAQDSVAKYQDKIGPRTTTEPTEDVSGPGPSAAPSNAKDVPPEPGPVQREAPPS